MQKQTTTRQISTVITNNLLTITKAECHYKSSNRIDEIDIEKFRESLDFLCESGIFAESLGWNYELDHKSGSYIFETGRYNPHSEIIITVYMRICNGASSENVEKELLFLED